MCYCTVTNIAIMIIRDHSEDPVPENPEDPVPFLTCAAAFWLAEEIERLELELDEKGAEIEQLQEEKAGALKELEHQEELQQSLRQQSQEQQQRQEQLEMELDTKSELVCKRAFTFLCANHNI